MDDRYSRNRIYIKDENQEKIKNFRILLAGAGIGSVIAECALRIGFENITVIDGDNVELTNLNRQNYTMEDIEKPKVECLRKRLLLINPDANIKTHKCFINSQNATGLIKNHDLAINALDFNSDVPFLFDSICQQYSIPILHPYNIGWAGLVAVIMPDDPQIDILSEKKQMSEVDMVEYITSYLRFWSQPQKWIEEVITEYKNEKKQLPPPQLSAASWIVASLCTHIMYNLANNIPVKRFPKFYLSSIFDDDT